MLVSDSAVSTFPFQPEPATLEQADEPGKFVVHGTAVARPKRAYEMSAARDVVTTNKKDGVTTSSRLDSDEEDL